MNLFEAEKTAPEPLLIMSSARHHSFKNRYWFHPCVCTSSSIPRNLTRLYEHLCSVKKHFLSSLRPSCCAWAFSQAVPAASALMSAAHTHSNWVSRRRRRHCHLFLSPDPLPIHYFLLMWRSSAQCVSGPKPLSAWTEQLSCLLFSHLLLGFGRSCIGKLHVPTSSPSWASFQCPLSQFSIACHLSLTGEGKGFKIHLKYHLIFPVLNLFSAGFINLTFDFVSNSIWPSKKKALNMKFYFCYGSSRRNICLFGALIAWNIMCQGFVLINSFVHNYRLFSS